MQGMWGYRINNVNEDDGLYLDAPGFWLYLLSHLHIFCCQSEEWPRTIEASFSPPSPGSPLRYGFSRSIITTNKHLQIETKNLQYTKTFVPLKQNLLSSWGQECFRYTSSIASHLGWKMKLFLTHFDFPRCKAQCGMEDKKRGMQFKRIQCAHFVQCTKNTG